MSEDLLFFGTIGIEQGYLTQDQVEESLKIQENLQRIGCGEDLGDICVKLGFLKPTQVEQILTLQSKRIKEHAFLYGKIGLANGLFEEDQLEECLGIQKKEEPHSPLGYHLLIKGYISPRDHQAVLKSIERIHRNQELFFKAKKGTPSQSDSDAIEVRDYHYSNTALMNGFVTSPQIEEYSRQKKDQPNPPKVSLSEFLLAKRYISEADHFQILYLIEKSKISPSPLLKKRPRDSKTPYTPARKEPYLKGLQEQFSQEATGVSPEEMDRAGTEINANPKLVHLFPDYILERKLGRGGMAVVFKGRTKTGEEVALKVMIPPSQDSKKKYSYRENQSKAKVRFIQEASILTTLKHPNIVRIIDAGSQEDYLYYVMEYLRGKSLLEVLEDSPDVYMEEQWALEIAREVARGLEEISKYAIVHRDIKPENIMISKGGEVKIFDFGIAKLFHPDYGLRKITSQNTILGTPIFLSPEQGRMGKDDKIDFRSDMYSLGVCLYLMVVGEPPYYDKSPMSIIMMHCLSKIPVPRERRPEISQDTSDLIQRMMAKNPQDRFPSYKKLIEEIDGIMKLLG